MSINKLYAVRSGRVAGVFTTVPAAMEQVSNFRAAEFNAFDKLQDADAYIWQYAQLYECNPPLDNKAVVVQVFAQNYELKNGKKQVSAAACANSDIVVVGEAKNPHEVQVCALYEVVKRIPDEPGAKSVIFVGGETVQTGDELHLEPDTFASDALKALDDLCKEHKTDDPAKFKDDPKMAAFADEFDTTVKIWELNDKRKHKLCIVPSREIQYMWAVRAPLFTARRLANHYANQHSA